MIFLPDLSCRGVWRYTLITHHIGLTQIDLIKQIYYFFRGFRESLFHIAAGAADGAENLYNRINLCEPNTYLHLIPRSTAGGCPGDNGEKNSGIRHGRRYS